MMTHIIRKRSGGEYSFLEMDKMGVYRAVDRRSGVAFNGIDSYGLISEWVPSSDNWSIEMDVYLHDDTIDEQTIIAGDGFRIFVDGYVDQGTDSQKGNPILELEQTSVPTTIDIVPITKERSANEKWLNITIEYDGTNLTTRHGNIVTSSEVISFDPITISRIGSTLAESGWMDGKIKNLILTDHNLPANNRYYAAIKQQGDYILDMFDITVDVNDPDLWGVAPAGVATDTEENTITMDGLQSDGALVDSGIDAVIGDHFIITYTINDGSQGQFQIDVGGSDGFNHIPGTYHYVGVCGASRNINFVSGSGVNKFNGTISNISIVVTNAIKLINHNQVNWYQKTIGE